MTPTHISARINAGRHGCPPVFIKENGTVTAGTFGINDAVRRGVDLAY
jgi:hypothetical protein